MPYRLHHPWLSYNLLSTTIASKAVLILDTNCSLVSPLPLLILNRRTSPPPLDASNAATGHSSVECSSGTQVYVHLFSFVVHLGLPEVYLNRTGGLNTLSTLTSSICKAETLNFDSLLEEDLTLISPIDIQRNKKTQTCTACCPHEGCLIPYNVKTQLSHTLSAPTIHPDINKDCN